MNPVTVLPVIVGSGVIVTLIVPVSPGASISGLKVLVFNVRSAQASPLSADTAESNGFINTNALVLMEAVGTPIGPYGPISEGMLNHALYGISGSLINATTVSLPTLFA